MSDDQKNNGMNPDEPPPFPSKGARKPISVSAAAGATRSNAEPPPFPPRRAQAASDLPLTPLSIPKSIAKAMTVVVVLSFLISTVGALMSLDNNDELLGGTRGVMAFWLSFLQNAFALFACVMTLRKTKRYWLPIMASVLTVTSWFWLSFTMLPMGLVFVGTVASIGIGIRSFVLFRKPEVRYGFDSQSDPVDWLGQIVLPRLPKFTVAPTPSNISRVSVLSLSGLCLVGILIGGALHNHDDRIWKLNEERKEKEKEAQRQAQWQAEEAKRIQEEQKAAQSFADANALWNSGKKAEAVSKYRSLLGNPRAPRELDRHLVRDRVINFDVEHGDLQEATNLITDALNSGEKPSLESSKAQELLSKVAAEKAAAEKVAAERAVAERAAAEKAAAEQAAERAATSGWFRKDNIVFTKPGALLTETKLEAANNIGGMEFPAGSKVQILKVEIYDGVPVAEIRTLHVSGEMTNTVRNVYENWTRYTKKSMLTPE